MVSRNNKRTRNRNKKSKNKRERGKKSMNKYKRSLKKQRVRRTKNKKLQKGGLIKIQNQHTQGADYEAYGGLKMEETFNKKHKQFYNAYVYRLFNMKTSDDQSNFSFDTEPAARTNNQHQFAIPSRVVTSDNGSDVKIGLGRHSESTANWLIPESLDTINGMAYEMYYGYVSAFLTPYGRALAYSTGYYEYGDHIIKTGENLEFYSSTLPRSMITAMLILRGVIDRLTYLNGDSDERIRGIGVERLNPAWISNILHIYKEKKIRVVYGCSEEPVGGTIGAKGWAGSFGHQMSTRGQDKFFHGDRFDFAQRIMSSEMLKPMVEFINATESGDTNIQLVLNSKNRPYLWRQKTETEQGDESKFYLSNHETLDRFFHELSNIQDQKRLGDEPEDGTSTLENTRHIVIVHGIVMEKYISWPFFTGYFEEFIPPQSPTAETREAALGTEQAGAVRPLSGGGEAASSEIQPSEIFIDNLLEYIRDTKISLSEKLSKVLFWGGYNLDTIMDMFKKEGVDVRSDKLKTLSEEYRNLIVQLKAELSFDEDGTKTTGLDKVLEKIDDPRFSGSEWFKAYLLNGADKLTELVRKDEERGVSNVSSFTTQSDKLSAAKQEKSEAEQNYEEAIKMSQDFKKGEKNVAAQHKANEAIEQIVRLESAIPIMEADAKKAETLQTQLIDYGPLDKTPFNCCTVMFSFRDSISVKKGREDEIDYTDDTESGMKRENIRNLHLLHCCRDVKFVAPSVIIKKCPPPSIPQERHAKHSNYQALINLISKNKPDRIHQTDSIIMRLITLEDIKFSCKVNKEKRSTLTWPQLYLAIRGNGIYFYDSNPIEDLTIEARGSSCHDISTAKVETGRERFFMGELRGSAPYIHITFEGNSYRGIRNEKFTDIKFAFYSEDDFSNCLRFVKEIGGGEDRPAGAQTASSTVDDGEYELVDITDGLQPEPENIYLNRWLDKISPGETSNKYMKAMKDTLNEINVKTLKGLSSNKDEGENAMAVLRPLSEYNRKAEENFTSHLNCLPDYQEQGCQGLKTSEIEKILNEAESREF